MRGHSAGAGESTRWMIVRDLVPCSRALPLLLDVEQVIAGDDAADPTLVTHELQE
jgi:hypothetical protein